MADFTTTIGLSDEQFQRTLRRLEGSVEQSSRRMGRSLGGVGSPGAGGAAGGGGLSGVLTRPGFVTGAAVARRFVGVGAALSLAGGTASAVSRAAQQDPEAGRQLSRLPAASASFGASLGRDLLPAMTVAAGLGERMIATFSRLREGASNFFGDAFGSIGDSRLAREAKIADEIAERQAGRNRLILDAQSQSRLAVLRAQGRQSEARELEVQIQLQTRLREIEKERADEIGAARKLGLGDQLGAEIANINAAKDALIGLARAETEAARSASELALARRKSAFDFARRRLEASIAGDTQRVANIDRAEEARRAQRNAEDEARAIGLGPAEVAERGRLARDESFIRNGRTEAERAQEQSRELGISVSMLRIQQLTGENRRMEAIDLSERLELERFIQGAAEQSAATEAERTRAIEEGTAAIRARFRTERDAERARAEGERERQRDFSRSVEDRLLGLRASRLEAQGRRSEALEIRKQLEIESITRDILRDQTRTRADMNRLIEEARKEVEAFFEAQERGGGRAAGRGLDPGLGVFAGQVFGFGPGERRGGESEAPARVVRSESKDLSEIREVVGRIEESFRKLV